MHNILVVEDDVHIRDMVLYILQKEDYGVVGVNSAEEALLHCERQKPDLIVLDIQLPGLNGYQLCERLMQLYRTNMPLIIMLTDKNDISDIEKGLASYADDYIGKPFNPRLLVARIQANLRRHAGFAEPPVDESFSLQGVVIDVPSRQVSVDNEAVRLQKMEFDILLLLMSSPNRVFSRDAIVSHSKGDSYYITDRAIDNQIYKLRKKLGVAGQHLQTVSGVGYRFSDTPVPNASDD